MWCHGLNVRVHALLPPKFISRSLTPSGAVFGEGASLEVLTLNKVLRVEFFSNWCPYRRDTRELSTVSVHTPRKCHAYHSGFSREAEGREIDKVKAEIQMGSAALCGRTGQEVPDLSSPS